MGKFEKMIEKKKKSDKGMSDVEKQAKMNVVNGLRDMASSEMSKRLGGLKKVSVMADSKEDMEKGLDKAKDLMSQMPENKHMDGHDLFDRAKEEGEIADPEESEHGEEDESQDMEENEDHEGMSEDELDQKLQQLMAVKEKMKSKKKMV